MMSWPCSSNGEDKHYVHTFSGWDILEESVETRQTDGRAV